MKKTLTVNLAGTVYNIDEDAYRLLDEYLTNLKHYFQKQEGADEIVVDIEARIAELFAEKITYGQQVITIQDVEEIIARVGKPEDFAETDEESATADKTGTTANSGTSAKSTAEPKQEREYIKRRLYRNPDDKMLGGVASGLAAYMGWDVTLVRLIMVVLLFVPYAPMIIAYIICWIVIPEARTAAEKLSMHGEEVTVENIGKTVTDGFEKAGNKVNDYMKSDKPRSLFHQIGEVLVSIAGAILKVLLVVLIVILCPALFLLLLIFIVLIIAAVVALFSGAAVLTQMIPFVDWTSIITISPILIVLGGIAFVALIGIPLCAFVYTIMRQLFHWTPMSSAMKWTLLVLWLVSLVIVIINISTIGWHLPMLALPFL